MRAGLYTYSDGTPMSAEDRVRTDRALELAHAILNVALAWKGEGHLDERALVMGLGAACGSYASTLVPEDKVANARLFAEFVFKAAGVPLTVVSKS